MKFLTSFKFLLMSFLAIQLSLCSNDNDSDNQDENETTADLITLDLSSIEVAEEDTTFTLKEFVFNNSRAKSEDFFIAEELNGEDVAIKGVSIWNDGTVFRFIELNLDDESGIKSVTTRLFNNGTFGYVSLYNGNQLVEEVETSERISDITLDLDGKNYDRLRLWSAEGMAISIKINY